MNVYATDTHALVWHLASPRRLGQAARAAFEEADDGSATIHVPATALIECLMVAEKQRVPGFTTEVFLNTIGQARFSRNYRLGVLTQDIILGSVKLAAVPEIFDRLIVAEALSLGAPLITRDPVIRDSGLIVTVWD